LYITLVWIRAFVLFLLGKKAFAPVIHDEVLTGVECSNPMKKDIYKYKKHFCGTNPRPKGIWM